MGRGFPEGGEEAFGGEGGAGCGSKFKTQGYASFIFVSFGWSHFGDSIS